MKKLTLVFLGLLALMVQSCDQWPPGNGGSGHGDDNPSIVGEWVWLQSDGGIYPVIYTPEGQGFQATLKFGGDKTYKLEQSNDVRQFGKYRSGKFQDRETVILDRPQGPSTFFSVALPMDENFVEFRGKDTLVLSGTGADMLTYVYVRAD